MYSSACQFSSFRLPHGLLCRLQIAHHIPRFPYLIGFVLDKRATLSRFIPLALHFLPDAVLYISRDGLGIRRAVTCIIGLTHRVWLAVGRRGPAACVYHGFRNTCRVQYIEQAGGDWFGWTWLLRATHLPACQRILSCLTRTMFVILGSDMHIKLLTSYHAASQRVSWHHDQHYGFWRVGRSTPMSDWVGARSGATWNVVERQILRTVPRQ